MESLPPLLPFFLTATAAQNTLMYVVTTTHLTDICTIFKLSKFNPFIHSFISISLLYTVYTNCLDFLSFYCIVFNRNLLPNPSSPSSPAHFSLPVANSYSNQNPPITTTAPCRAVPHMLVQVIVIRTTKNTPSNNYFFQRTSFAQYPTPPLLPLSLTDWCCTDAIYYFFWNMDVIILVFCKHIVRKTNSPKCT